MTTARSLRISYICLAGFIAFASSASAAVTLEPGTDRMGSDYKSFAVDQGDPRLCLQACDADAACKSYTYVKPGLKGPKAMCFLKNSVPVSVADECCTSGQKTATLQTLTLQGLGLQKPKIQTALQTLAPGKGTYMELPAVKVPADLPASKVMELTGGKTGEPFMHLDPAHMSEPGKGWISILNPYYVMGDAGVDNPSAANLFATLSTRISEVVVNVMPIDSLLLFDCKVIAKEPTTIFSVQDRDGPTTLFNNLQAFQPGHLLFIANSGGKARVTISGNTKWVFLGCDVRKL